MTAFATLRLENVDRAWLWQALQQASPAGNNLGLPGLVSNQGFGPLWATYLVTALAMLLVLALAWTAKSPERRVAILVAGGMMAAPHALATDFILVAAAVLIAGDGGFVVWFILSAGSLAIALTPNPELAAAASVVLLGGFLMRFAGLWPVPHTIPSSQRASSVMRSGVHGGS